MRLNLNEVLRPTVDNSNPMTSIQLLEAAREYTTDFFDQYADLFPEISGEAAQGLIMTMFLNEYGKERLETRRRIAEENGKYPKNDPTNKAAGVIVYARQSAKDHIMTFYQDAAGYNVPVQVAPNLWAYKLPYGGYVDSVEHGVQFFDTVSDEWYSNGGGHPIFSLGDESLVRVEGLSGDLWQNPNFDWIGEPIQHQ